MVRSPFVDLVHDYDAWFDRYPWVYAAEVRAVRSLLPAGVGGEVGVGSGRFASALAVDFGFDQSWPMLKMAQQRGVEIGCGLAESLPIKSGVLDYVLMVTVLCFLKSPLSVLKELRRVLRSGGRIVIAFIDRETPVGKEYLNHQHDSAFYRDAKFYSAEEVMSLLRQAGFADFAIRQTIAAPLNEVGPNEPVLAGWGQGVFVVVSAGCAK